MRGSEAVLLAMGGLEITRATDEGHAANLLSAHLIETLSSIGREYIDFYFLRVREHLQDFQIAGALETLEMARQDGLVRFVGLCCDGECTATEAVWHLHDAFDVLLVQRNGYNSGAYDALLPLAKERRVGVVTSRPFNWGYGVPFFAMPSVWRLRNLTQSFYGLTVAQATLAELSKDHPVLVGVRNAEEVHQAIEAPNKPVPEGLDSMLGEFKAAFQEQANWDELLQSQDEALRTAAQRRNRDAQRV
jgi:predicted aldo/keto reductase-like oxidoreductase